MAFLLYRSRARVAPHSRAEARIWIEARHNNAAASITGYLHREDDWFVQAVEGPWPSIDALYRRLLCDGRHGAMDVMRLDRTDAPRLFSGWQIGFAQTPGVAAYAAWHGGEIGEADAPTLLRFLRTASDGLSKHRFPRREVSSEERN